MTETKSGGISRRTVVAGAAWSVPAIVIASNAPSMAATPPVVVGLGDACKHPGNSQGGKRYHFELIFTNSGDATQFKIDNIVLDANSGQDVTFSNVDYTTVYSIGEDGTVSVVVDSDLTTNSSQGNLIITYSYKDENGVFVQVETAITVPDLPPCDKSIGDFPHST